MNISNTPDYLGKELPGIKLNGKLFMGQMPLVALQHYGLKRPSVVEHSTVRARNADPVLVAAYTLREQVQRRFDKARMRRAEAFSVYLEEIYKEEREGGFPAITLFTPTMGRMREDNGNLVLDYNAPMVNLDGETQTEARFMLMERWESSGQQPVPFFLYHGISAEHAAAIMHDANFYAKPVAEQKVAILNSYGHLTAVIREVVKEMNIPPSEIARLTPLPKKKQLVAYQGLIAGGAGALIGRAVSDNLPKYITRLNNYVNGTDADQARPFLEHALNVVQSRREIGRTTPALWALVGGHYHDSGELLSADAWLSLWEAYRAVKVDRAEKQKAAIKRREAFRQALGIEIE